MNRFLINNCNSQHADTVAQGANRYSLQIPCATAPQIVANRYETYLALFAMRKLLTISLCVLISCRNSPKQATQSENLEWDFNLYSASVEDVKFRPDSLLFTGETEKFRSRLTQSLYDSVNFGGHCIFVAWGCGITCQSSAIIDLKTGKTIAGPSTATGYIFRADSRLLVVNPKFANLPPYIMRKT